MQKPTAGLGNLTQLIKLELSKQQATAGLAKFDA